MVQHSIRASAGRGGVARETAGGATVALVNAARGAAGIAGALRRAIFDGAYGYGDRLPPERELARLFGASRTTVRAALDRLGEGQLVTRRVGSGTFVSYRPEVDTGDVAEITSPIELIEVRAAIEPQMTRLAVLNATARDLGALRRALDELLAAGADAERFSRRDERFHLAIAECTHNPLMVAIYGHVNRVRGHAQWNARKDKILTAARIVEYNDQHRRLFDALVSRDVGSATALVNEHLDKARRDLLGVEPE